METTPISRLLLPRSGLAQCVFGGFLRDTRGCRLQPEQRFNHFAAAPLCALSILLDGAAHQISTEAHRITPDSAPMFPQVSFSGPQSAPTTSWNPGAVQGLIIVFYPDAISALTGLDIAVLKDRTVPLRDPAIAGIAPLVEPVLRVKNLIEAFEVFQDQLEPKWQQVRPHGSVFGQRIGDWSHALALRAALSPSGKSLRQLQRRIKVWTGQSMRSLQGFSRSDEAFSIALKDKERGALDFAGIAAEAGFADQSHMGRTVRLQTGFTPRELMRGIESDEAFWSFRLMGERY